MKTTPILIVGREDMKFIPKSKDIFYIELCDFIEYDKLKKTNKIILFIDDNGESLIIYNDYGDNGYNRFLKKINDLQVEINELNNNNIL